MPRALIQLVFFASFAAGMAGCAGPAAPPLAPAIVSEMRSLTDQTPAESDLALLDPQARMISLFAAANETVSFQLVLDADDPGVADIRLRASDLYSADRARIPAENVGAWRMVPVKVTEYPAWYLRLVEEPPRPAEFYEILVPLGIGPKAEALSLPARGRLAVWIDVRVPRGATTGVYAGTVTLSAAGRSDWRASVQLQVYDFVLPDGRPLAAIGGFSHEILFGAFLDRDGKPFTPSHLDRRQPRVRQGLEILRQLMQLGHEHRLDLFDKTLQPVLKRDLGGNLLLDWDDYDAILLPYLTGSAFEDQVGCPAWPMPFREDWPDPASYGGPASDSYAATAATVVALCAQHFASIPESADRLFLWPYRGPVEPAACEPQVRLARICRAGDPRTPVLCLLPDRLPPEAGWRAPQDLPELSDIYAPPAPWVDPARAVALLRTAQPLAGIWLSPGLPPYLPSLGIIASPADIRALPWLAMKYRCTGLLVPEVLNWSGDLLAMPAQADSRLFYPGKLVGAPGVLPSVRLKRLRRGLQDLAYLWLLRLRQREPVAQSVMDSLARYAGLSAAGTSYLDPRLDGWSQDSAAWEAARKLLAEEVLAAVHPEQAVGNRLLAQRVAWNVFMERTTSIRVEQARARILPGKNSRFRLSLGLDLYNETLQPVAAAVRLGNLPDGWKSLSPQGVTMTLAPGAGGRATLEAEGNAVPAAGNAKLPLSATLSADFRREEVVEAPAPFLLAGRISAPPRIDGKLDDWPMREGNAAGDFKLVGRRGRRGTGLAQRQTLVFATFDDQNLYLAFRCLEPKPSGMVVRASNDVRNDQFLTVGEDLVEVLLDPGLAAKGPQDLYRIVLKPNGVLVAERGVRSDPPLGPVAPWAARIAAAADVQQDVWTAELAIPLSAFGQAGRADLWGADFVRFATQGAEASSWSQARRFFYAPDNLGTLCFPRPSQP